MDTESRWGQRYGFLDENGERGVASSAGYGDWEAVLIDERTPQSSKADSRLAVATNAGDVAR